MDPADRQLRRCEGDDRQAEQRNEHDGLEEVLDRRRRVLEIRSSIQQIGDREPDALQGDAADRIRQGEGRVALERAGGGRDDPGEGGDRTEEHRVEVGKGVQRRSRHHYAMLEIVIRIPR